MVTSNPGPPWVGDRHDKECCELGNHCIGFACGFEFRRLACDRLGVGRIEGNSGHKRIS